MLGLRGNPGTRGILRVYVGGTETKGITLGVMLCTLSVLRGLDRGCETLYVGHTRSTQGIRGERKNPNF